VRYLCASLSDILLIVGCDVFTAFITLPDAALTIVPGGLSDTRPYFGKYRRADMPDADLGTFMLASCGCGDWRVLFKPDDGSPQTQFPIAFYTSGEYSPTGEIFVYGSEESNRFSGSVNQDVGALDAHAEMLSSRYLAVAGRAAIQEQTVDACLLCHVGDDPIWPLPETHPQKYKTNPRVCLECHEAASHK
jgi:hypothetical protein